MFKHRYDSPIFVAFRTLLWREILRFIRIWSQTLLPPAITTTLYFIIFGKFIGSQLVHIDGYSYIQYMAPGLILMSMMINAYANTSSSFFVAKFNKSIEEILVSPMPNMVILLGFMIGGALRGLLVGLLVLLVTLIFTHIPIMHPLAVLGLSLLIVTIFSLGGLINGIFARDFDDVAFVPAFILTPLTYLGGVFYSIKQLPHLWQTISLLNPILEMINVFRYAFLGVTDINIAVGVTMILFIVIALLFIAWFLLEKGVRIKY